MRSRSATGLLFLIGLFAARPVSATDWKDGGQPVWKTRIEYLSQFLQDEPSHVVRDHVVAMASGLSSLTFEYTDGGALNLSLENGELRLDGRVAGHYPEGGALETAWHQLLLESSHLDTPAALTALRNWHPAGLSREEEAYADLLRARAASLSAPANAVMVPQAVEPATAGGLTIDLSDLSNPARLAPIDRKSVV